AGDDCRFTQFEVKRNLMATGGATLRMVIRAGWGNAMRYLLTDDEFDAATALRLNYVQEVVPADQVLDRAVEIALNICAQSPLAVRATIANARKYLQEGYGPAVAEFDHVNVNLRRSKDAEEALAAFIEKRPPRFTGQ
ncbi:MAG: enoyl-CoA hydratase-related protein, partial [Alphaproteobacteria bacterium]|nr:enoyl-CoA hydratase-related protein [Alphaproteobacteria bacterium]